MYLRRNLLAVWPPNASLYASSTCVHSGLLAGPFGQGFTANCPIAQSDYNFADSSVQNTAVYAPIKFEKIIIVMIKNTNSGDKHCISTHFNTKRNVLYASQHKFSKLTTYRKNLRSGT